MMDYTGIQCPVCKEKFSKQDDIVVCPVCGAPYHRSCYLQEGKCKFEELHASGTAWQPPKEAEAGKTADEDVRRCPRCGKENNKYSLFCDHCGMPLSQEPPVGPSNNYGQFNQYPQWGNNENPSGHTQAPGNSGTPFSGNGFPPFGTPFAFDPMGGVNPTESIDGVPAGEISKLVQNNTAYYIPVFMNYKKNRRNRFNFCAFFCTGGWFLYRKQYKWGVILTSIMILLYGLSNYFSFMSQELLLQLMNQSGVDAGNFLSSPQLYSQFVAFVQSQPLSVTYPIVVYVLLQFVQLAFMLIIGFNANKMYCRHCVKKVREIRASGASPEDQAVQMQNQGGVNTAVAICLLICAMICIYVPNLFI